MPPSKSSSPRTTSAPKAEPEKPKPIEAGTLKVRAVRYFHDGNIPGGAAWKEGEVREVTPQVWKQLRASTRNGFEIVL